MIDEALLNAAVVALQEVGWGRLTLERVAAAAGVSRVTLWRQGVTLEQIIEGLMMRLTADYRALLWPTLTAEGTGRERLQAALQALCNVVDLHLPLLVATDTMNDGSLRAVDYQEMASILFNTVCWTYVHLRARHQWKPERVQALLLELVLEGLIPDK